MISNTANISKEEVQLLKQNKARIVDNDSCLEFNQQELRRLDAICKWIKLNKDYELKIDSTNKNRQAIMGLPWDSSFDVVELKKRLSMIEHAIKEIDKGIKLMDDLLVIRTYCVAMLKPLKEEIEQTRESFIKDRAFFVERQNTIKIQVEFITQADKKSKPCPKPRHIKPKVKVEKRCDQSHPYSEELTRMVYDYCIEEELFNVCWDVFNNAVMCGNYAQLDTPANAKAQLCQIIHLFDIYICGGQYGHNAANSIGLSGRTNLTQQASNLPENFKIESEQIFRQWAKKQSRK